MHGAYKRHNADHTRSKRKGRTGTYGTLPHQSIYIILQKHHVPDKVRKLLDHYYNNFRICFNVEEFTTNWQDLEVGIATGCTISAILFAAAANLLV